MKSTIAAMAAFAIFLLPAAAHADIVYEKGADIWVMEDDGTDGRVLVKASDLPDMDGGLGSPHVDPTGKTVAFTGNTKRHEVIDYGWCGYSPYTYPCWTWHYGFNATGVYLLVDGKITRQSPDPAYCYNCTMSDYSPELSAGATRHAYSFMHCQGTRSAGSYSCNSALSIRGEGAGTFGTVCGEGDAVSFDPAINPANANQIAYAGCSATVGEEQLDAVYVAEPGRANEHPVACDDTWLADPSFSPAGDRLVVSESGNTPGLWIYDPNVNQCIAGTTGVHAVVNPDPDNISFSSPRFVGADKLVFAVGTKSGETWSYDLYTVPASCDACAFPSAATKLTEGGESSSPAWTSARLAVLPPETPADGDGDGVPDSSDACPAQAGSENGCPPRKDNGGNTTTDGDGDGVPDADDRCPEAAGTGASDGCPQDNTTRTVLDAPTFAKTSFKKLLKRGLPVAVACTPGCRLSAAISIPGKLARKLKLTKSKRAKKVTVGKGRASLPQGGTETLTVGLTSKAKKAFRKRKRRLPKQVPFTVKVTGTGTDGTKLAPVTAQLRVKR